MTKLSPEEQKMRLGLVLPDPTAYESRRRPFLTTGSPVAIPPTLDWRNNGGNWVTPVRNQGGCGSCWAFSTTAALESAVLRHRQTPNVNLDLSEQVMISCGGFGSCAGGMLELASDYFVQYGLPPESCYPYTYTNGLCSAACANWPALAGQRDVPDTNQKFGATSSDPLVWQTYRSKVEIFDLATGTNAPPGYSATPPDYGYNTPPASYYYGALNSVPYQVQPCPGQTAPRSSCPALDFC